MKSVVAVLLVFFGAQVFAQVEPTLKCAVRYKEETKSMYWFALNTSHHVSLNSDLLNVSVKEKAGDRVEIVIMEAAADDVWDNLTEVLNKSDLSDEMRTKIRALGRTRMTKAYVGLHNDLLQFEHRLGSDRNMFEISCMKQHQWPKF